MFRSEDGVVVREEGVEVFDNVVAGKGDEFAVIVCEEYPPFRCAVFWRESVSLEEDYRGYPYINTTKPS
jgi:hypothetical protein